MKNIFLLIGMTTLLGACVSPTKIPTVRNSSGSNVFVWHDLISSAPKASEAFYSELFEWTFNSLGKNYSLITDKNQIRIGGFVDNRKAVENQQSALWLCVVRVENVDATLEKVRLNGGTVLKDTHEVPDRGTIAVLMDPEGAVVQIVETDVSALPPEKTTWIWHELLAEDPVASVSWYEDVFDLKSEKTEDGKRYLLKKGNETLASVSENPFEDTRSQWIPVLVVSDFDRITKTAETLGGKVQTLPTSRNQQLALIVDPNNAPLVIQTKGAGQ